MSPRQLPSEGKGLRSMVKWSIGLLAILLTYGLFTMLKLPGSESFQVELTGPGVGKTRTLLAVVVGTIVLVTWWNKGLSKAAALLAAFLTPFWLPPFFSVFF